MMLVAGVPITITFWGFGGLACASGVSAAPTRIEMGKGVKDAVINESQFYTTNEAMRASK